jgi:hypothetical protein
MGGQLLRSATLFAVLAVQTLGAADLSGKWVFSFNTPEGIIDGTLELTQVGEKLSAKFDESKLEGSATESQFTLKGDYFAPTAGYTSGLSIKGKPEGEGLSGSAIWDVYDLTFTAKRVD